MYKPSEKINTSITVGTFFIFLSLIAIEQERRLGDLESLYWVGIKLFFVTFASLLFFGGLMKNNINLHKYFFPILILFFLGSLGIQFVDKIQTVIFIFSMIYIYWAYLSNQNIISHFKLFID